MITINGVTLTDACRISSCGNCWEDDCQHFCHPGADRSCKCGAHIVFMGTPGIGGSWMATDGERPGDFHCPDGSLHLPADQAELFPLTCTFCRHACATHVLIWDTADKKRGPARTTALVCGGCAHRDEERARQIASSPASAWLFRLAPDNEETCDA